MRKPTLPFWTLLKLGLLILLFSLACPPLLQAASEAGSAVLNPNYQRLKKVYDYYQSIQYKPWPEITQLNLKRGMVAPEIALLRERLVLTGDLPNQHTDSNEHFDAVLEQAVRGFQWRHGLNPDGIVGAKTLNELNVKPIQRAEQIRLNMEHWAALPASLGKRFIFINIPEYRFDLVDNGQIVLTMKVIVGRPDRPTPEFSSAIDLVELNPYWNVPPLIAEKDVLPKILKNPHYLDEMNIKVIQRKGSQVIPIDKSTINWEEVAANGLNYDFRQEPGKNNALGFVKFDFPNSYDVYMHDTPAKELFNLDKRDFSSGCIRLEKPFALLSYLLQNDPSWDVHQVAEALASGKLAYIKVSRPIPLYVIYATAWVDRNGILHFLRDPYGYNEEPDPEEFAPQAKIDAELTMPLSFYA